ncbi:MAG TPA: undecaprenyl-diphosphate phosphatase [Gemmatimonadales bacterium]|nr:undecaprenyl-diphosphate phosphatase [Gemmatimonadales bacterium]
MTIWQAVVLGLVQGLTEFLPVSSSGHLVLAERLLGVETPGVFVEVALHAATLASVLVVFGRRLAALAVGVVHGRGEDLRYAALLLVATVPAGLVGVLLGDLVERAFDSLVLVGCGLVVTGGLLWLARRSGGQRPRPSAPGALAIGAMQALAVLPGVSRSGATVSAGLLHGLSPARAAEFSFLMAVPVIAGAAMLEAREAAAEVARVGAVPLVVSCVVALASGIWAIRFLVRLVERGRFHAFAPYCWGVGLLTIALSLWPG